MHSQFSIQRTKKPHEANDMIQRPAKTLVRVQPRHILEKISPPKSNHEAEREKLNAAGRISM